MVRTAIVRVLFATAHLAEGVVIPTHAELDLIGMETRRETCNMQMTRSKE